MGWLWLGGWLLTSLWVAWVTVRVLSINGRLVVVASMLNLCELERRIREKESVGGGGSPSPCGRRSSVDRRDVAAEVNDDWDRATALARAMAAAGDPGGPVRRGGPC